MELREIIEKCRALDIYEERFIADNYYEIVSYAKDQDKWVKLFTEILGPAAKPAGIAPNKEDAELTQKYGGVRENQTLFKKQTGKTIIAVMFWPWQDEVRITLKIAVIEKSHYEKLP